MSQPATESSDSSTDLEIAARVKEVVSAALDLKAVDLRVLHLEPVTDFTDYFLVCSGTSARQVEAIARAVDERLRGDRVRPLHIEGQGKGTWILLDYGDFVVHIFDEERRSHYALERLWGDAPDVTEEFVN